MYYYRYYHGVSLFLYNVHIVLFTRVHEMFVCQIVYGNENNLSKGNIRAGAVILLLS